MDIVRASQFFGRPVVRLDVPGMMDGQQRVTVEFDDGETIDGTGADTPTAFSNLVARYRIKTGFWQAA